MKTVDVFWNKQFGWNEHQAKRTLLIRFVHSLCSLSFTFWLTNHVPATVCCVTSDYKVTSSAKWNFSVANHSEQSTFYHDENVLQCCTLCYKVHAVHGAIVQENYKGIYDKPRVCDCALRDEGLRSNIGGQWRAREIFLSCNDLMDGILGESNLFTVYFLEAMNASF